MHKLCKQNIHHLPPYFYVVIVMLFKLVDINLPTNIFLAFILFHLYTEEAVVVEMVKCCNWH